MKGRASSSVVTPGPALLPAIAGEGGGIFPSLAPLHRKKSCRASSLALMAIGSDFAHAPDIRVCSAIQYRQGAQPALPSAASGKGQSQLSCSHEPTLPPPTGGETLVVEVQVSRP